MQGSNTQLLLQPREAKAFMQPSPSSPRPQPLCTWTLVFVCVCYEVGYFAMERGGLSWLQTWTLDQVFIFSHNPVFDVTRLKPLRIEGERCEKQPS